MRLNNLFLSTYEHRSKKVSSRRLVNCHIESTDGMGVSDPILTGRGGQKRFADKSADPTYSGAYTRGLYTTSTGRLFCAFETYLCEVDSSGAVTKRHTINYGSPKVYMCDDGVNMAIADGTTLWIYNLSTNVVTTPPISEVDFNTPIKLIYCSNRAVCINADPTFRVSGNEITRKANSFYWSELLNFSKWSALNFATAEQSADTIISIEKGDNDLWLFGARSYEVWRSNPVDPNMPFVYVGGSSGDIGCASADSVASIGGLIFWLGSGVSGLGNVYMSQGSNAIDIADSALGTFISSNQTKIGDAVGFALSQEGRYFYVLTFIQLNRTFVYDVNLKSWHERSTREPLLNIHNKWRPAFSAFAFGKTIVGDIQSPTLYTLENDYYMDDLSGTDSVPIVRIMQSGNFTTEGQNPIFIREIRADIETGVSLENDPSKFGYDPKLSLEISRDGGYTWGIEDSVSIGRQGERRKIVRYRRKGRCMSFALRFTFSAPSRFILIGADLEVF